MRLEGWTRTRVPALALRDARLRKSRSPESAELRRAPQGEGSADLHHRRSAAVDIDRRAGDIRARITGEEARHVGEFLGAADAAERHVLDHAGNVIRQR